MNSVSVCVCVCADFIVQFLQRYCTRYVYSTRWYSIQYPGTDIKQSSNQKF
jgi:hypothetical protein